MPFALFRAVSFSLRPYRLPVCMTRPGTRLGRVAWSRFRFDDQSGTVDRVKAQTLALFDHRVGRGCGRCFAVAHGEESLSVGTARGLAGGAVLSDREGRPLARSLTVEQQWRLPVSLEEISPWLRKATIAVEDERFEQHPGSGLRFGWPGLPPEPFCRWSRFGGKHFGYATLSDARSSAANPRIQTFRGVPRLAGGRFLSKDEVLQAYLNLAPYGGNLQGAEAASLRYFGKSAKNFHCPRLPCWQVFLNLPPVCVRIDTPKPAAKRRNKVLDRMSEEGMISSEEARELMAEPIELELGLLTGKSARHFVTELLSSRPEGGLSFWIPGCRRKSRHWPVNAFLPCRLVRILRLRSLRSNRGASLRCSEAWISSILPEGRSTRQRRGGPRGPP